MFVIHDSVCAAGGRQCEDAVTWGRDFFAAVDGASGLTGSCIMGTGSDAAWFAQGFCRHLKAILDLGDTRPTEDILTQVLKLLEQEYRQGADEKGVPVPPDSPSACICLFRQIGETVEYYGLGDCVGTVLLKDGTVHTMEEQALSALDNKVICRMDQIHRQTGVDVLEARASCNDMLLEHRMLRNTPEGYWILDLSGKGVAHARTGRWRADEIQSAAAYSDGFAQMSEYFNLYGSPGDMLKAMAGTSLQEMKERLFRAQEEDPVCNHHPRLKFRDDACAVWATVAK